VERKDASIEVMEFLRSTHRLGLNTTVRRGLKWRDKLVPSQIFKIVKTNNPGPYSYAKCVFILVCVFDEIPNQVYSYEHDPQCRDRSGLEKAMHTAYSDFNIKDTVVVVGYTVQ
jgi:hypothetical protein